MSKMFDDGFRWACCREIRERIELAISTMEAKLAQVARLWLFEEMTEPEIALVMGLSRDQVARTKRAVREHIMKFFGDWPTARNDYLAA